MKNTLDYIVNTPVAAKYGAPTDGFRNWIQSPIRCADGTELSVQASRGHYCSPRGDEAPYSAVEVQLAPGESEGNAAEWNPYRDGEFSETYGYVPIELVRSFIQAHGGEASA